ncbi:MAG TPA: hypothetical protein G4N91_04190 [Dehalococcoidia bacterium]|nr:hypothetical protein [Dehalococcoidia bacterium]
MKAILKDPKLLLFGKGRRWYQWHAWIALALDLLGTACLIVGIIGAALDKELGLGAIVWVIIAIALWVGGLWSWLCAYTIDKQ